MQVGLNDVTYREHKHNIKEYRHRVLDLTDVFKIRLRIGWILASF